MEKRNLEIDSRHPNICIPQIPDLFASATKSRIALPWTEEVRPAGVNFIRSIDFERQILLHLARFPLPERIITAQIWKEARRIAARLAARRMQAPREITGSDLAGVEFRRTHLDLVDSDLAQAVHKAFHYLGSPRAEGIHLGLYAELPGCGRPRLMSLVSLSPFDLWHIRGALPYAVHPEEVLVLSRLFAFDTAPPNTVSFTLGRIFAWLQTHMPSIKALISYLNPNLGFRGTVYKATNWRLLGEESKSRYLYIGGNYVTDRYAIKTYGTADASKLADVLGSAFSTSVRQLLPLQIFIYFLDPSLRAVAPPTFGNHFVPDSTLVGGAAK